MGEEMVKKIKIDFLTTFFLLIIFLFYVLTRFENQGQLTVVIRIIFLCCIIILFLSVFSYKKIQKGQITIFTIAIIFQLIYVFNIRDSFNIDTLFIIIHHIIFFMLLYITSNIKWEKNNILVFNIIVTIIYLFLLLYVFIRTGIVNTNTIGSYAYLLSFFPLLYYIGYRGKVSYIGIFIVIITSLGIIYFTGTRSIFFAVFFSLLTFILWKYISSKKLYFNMYFIIITSMIFIITFFYPQIRMLNNFEKYNSLSITYTGKSLLSGRHTLWEALIELIKMQPFLGYGSGILPNDLIDIDLTSHNLYIQIALQVGVFGLVMLLMILFLIWRKYWLNANNPKVKLASCYFIGIFAYQVFEVTLTQNNFGAGVLQWLIIGIGLSYTTNSISYTNHKKKKTF